MTYPHISIAGAGLGGLCLAQGLKRRGIDFAVYERDDTFASRSQGYRIRIDSNGQGALEQCLPADLYALFRACSIVSQRARFVSHDLLAAPAIGPEQWQSHASPGTDRAASDDLCVHRQTLREILLSGIEERVHFGKPIQRFEVLDGGSVRIEFANGDSRVSDLLVGADGVHSGVRDQLVPDARPLMSGDVCIYGKTPATFDLRRQIDAKLLDGTSVIFADGFAVIVDPMLCAEPLPDIAMRLARTCRVEPVEDYVYWAFIGSPERLGVDFGTLPNEQQLPALIESLVQAWHPGLRRLLSAANDLTATIVPVRNAPTPIASWPPGPVTLLGDAIHTMSPAAGVGANTALQDAASLADALVQATSASEAISAFETTMRKRASHAICASIAGTRKLCAMRSQ